MKQNYSDDALLLICSLLAPDILKKHELCNRLGLSALVEAHTKKKYKVP